MMVGTAIHVRSYMLDVSAKTDEFTVLYLGSLTNVATSGYGHSPFRPAFSDLNRPLEMAFLPNESLKNEVRSEDRHDNFAAINVIGGTEGAFDRGAG
ncbi:hypothetical protein J2W42_006185 [Rhizobium tibeticum]|nr:hypothetical protein [Rhizobium tibeticum]